MTFDWHLSIGNVLTIVALLFAVWRYMRSEIASKEAAAMSKADTDFRIKNLETWRKEHMRDADARDDLIRRIDTAIEVLTAIQQEQSRVRKELNNKHAKGQ